MRTLRTAAALFLLLPAAAFADGERSTGAANEPLLVPVSALKLEVPWLPGTTDPRPAPQRERSTLLRWLTPAPRSEAPDRRSAAADENLADALPADYWAAPLPWQINLSFD